MMKLEQCAAIGLIFLVPLAACVAMGDGYVEVIGRIVNEAGDQVDGCTLSLHTVGEEIASPKAPVYAVFRAGETIGGTRQSYFFEVECSQYQTYETEIYTFAGDTYARTPLDLGVIVMRK